MQGAFYWSLKVSFCVLVLKETGLPQFLTDAQFLSKQYQFTEGKKCYPNVRSNAPFLSF